MSRKAEPELVPFRCPRCGRLVVWALGGATVRCPKCGTWFTSSKGEEAKARGKTAS